MGSGKVRGVQWEITTKINCSDFITCIKRKVVEYNDVLIHIISIGDPIAILLLGGS